MSSATTTTSTYSPELTGDYSIDTVHSRLGFVARHAMVSKVRGQFNDFEGTLHLDATDPSKSSARITIDVASVDTRNEQRDDHLRTNDFFDAPNHPKITFVSTSIEPRGEDRFAVGGELAIRGVTKPVTIDLEFTGLVKAWGTDRAGFEGRLDINRQDYGVNFNSLLEAGGIVVSDKVTIEIDIEAVKVA